MAVALTDIVSHVFTLMNWNPGPIEINGNAPTYFNGATISPSVGNMNVGVDPGPPGVIGKAPIDFNKLSIRPIVNFFHR